MAGRVRLIGQGEGPEAKVHVPNDKMHTDTPGLVVYSHPLEVGTPVIKFFSDENGNVDQNVNASGAGTLVGVYDGGDSALWTASALVGSWGLTSTAQAHTGTRSVDATGTRNGDILSLSNGAPLNVGDYSAVRGFVYITSWPSSGNKNMEVQLFSGAAQIGVTVDLSAYVDTTIQDQWQVFEIPILDFATSAGQFDEIRFAVVDSGRGSAPALYLDDIALVSAGTSGSVQYTIEPNVNEVLVVNRLKWTAVATSGAIKPDEFFGISGLTNGYTFSFVTARGVSQTFTAKNFYQMAQYPNVTLDIISGTNSIFEVYFDIPLEQQILFGSLGQKIVLTVRDDLSSMAQFRCSLQGYLREQI